MKNENNLSNSWISLSDDHNWSDTFNPQDVMKTLIHEKKTTALMVGENYHDAETLAFLYYNGIVFGLYSLWLRTPEMKGAERPEIAGILKRFPKTTAIGFLSYTKGFADTYKKEIVPEENMFVEKFAEKKKDTNLNLFNLEDIK
jgi:hypothetical protein